MNDTVGPDGFKSRSPDGELIRVKWSWSAGRMGFEENVEGPSYHGC